MDLELRQKERHHLDTRLDRQRLGIQLQFEEFKVGDLVLVDESFYEKTFSKKGVFKARVKETTDRNGITGLVVDFLTSFEKRLFFQNTSVPVGAHDILTLLVPAVSP